jgi:hypothetical protein
MAASPSGGRAIRAYVESGGRTGEAPAPARQASWACGLRVRYCYSRADAGEFDVVVVQRAPKRILIALRALVIRQFRVDGPASPPWCAG